MRQLQLITKKRQFSKIGKWYTLQVRHYVNIRNGFLVVSLPWMGPIGTFRAEGRVLARRGKCCLMSNWRHFCPSVKSTNQTHESRKSHALGCHLPSAPPWSQSLSKDMWDSCWVPCTSCTSCHSWIWKRRLHHCHHKRLQSTFCLQVASENGLHLCLDSSCQNHIRQVSCGAWVWWSPACSNAMCFYAMCFSYAMFFSKSLDSYAMCFSWLLLPHEKMADDFNKDTDNKNIHSYFMRFHLLLMAQVTYTRFFLRVFLNMSRDKDSGGPSYIHTAIPKICKNHLAPATKHWKFPVFQTWRLINASLYKRWM